MDCVDSMGRSKFDNAVNYFIIGAVFVTLFIPKWMDKYNEWGVAIIMSIALTVIAEAIIKQFGGEFLKDIKFGIWGRRISLFSILTILIKIFYLK